MSSHWEQRLRAAGYRMTASRRAVLRVLEQSPRPLSTGELHELARRHHARLGLVTAYRTLEVLEQLGLVRRIHGDGSCHAFVAASPGHSHAITCDLCARTTEFEGADVCLLTDGVEEKTGYRISGHWLQLMGVCPVCRGAGG
jgi:Fur family ferric uptake transcriptional regulator